MGEYIGIRYGRVDPNNGEIEWIYKPHDTYDGIGGFASILRENGIELESLPVGRSQGQISTKSVLKALPQLAKPRRVLKWLPEISNISGLSKDESNFSATPSSAVSWHVFTEKETQQIALYSHKNGITVNSVLLKHLSSAVRPSFEEPSEVMPWMIPVNLRGRVIQESDTGNHSSYVAIKIGLNDSDVDVHQSIYSKIAKDEQAANWKAYELTRSLPESIKKYLIETNRAMLQWNIGSFSNLGIWDPGKLIDNEYCAAPWLFAPPVLKCQLLGAGCITFQGRLSVMLQAHPVLTVSEEIVSAWVKSWVEQIELNTQ